MLDAVQTILGPIWPYLVAAVTAVVVYITGRAQGKAKAETVQAQKEAANTRETFNTVNEVSRDTNAMSDDAVNSELADDWVQKLTSKRRS